MINRLKIKWASGQERGTDDALIIVESIISKSIEVNAPLWFASLDLRKAFDRIEWPQLFQVLSEQKLPIEYQCLLSCLYENQVGVLAGGDQFPIRRGVRQGDVLSPLLFNAGLEQTLRCWKHRLRNHGIKLDNGDEERLTNVRFADDLIIYAKSMPELVDALDILAEELQNVGLDLNAKKSKLFTTDRQVSGSEKPIHVEAAGEMIEVARAKETHKYLGASLPGDLRFRGKANLAHRLKCAWSKFHLFYASPTNKHVNIKLRLRLFDTVVTPAVLYGLTAFPLTQHDIEQLGVTQRKMLRKSSGGRSWQMMNGRMYTGGCGPKSCVPLNSIRFEIGLRSLHALRQSSKSRSRQTGGAH